MVTGVDYVSTGDARVFGRWFFVLGIKACLETPFSTTK